MEKIQILKKLLPGAVFAAIVILFFREFLAGDKIFGYRDLSLYFYPIRYFMVQEIRSLVFPFWNPYIFFGQPLFAGLQAGVLYPLSIVLYLFPFNLGFNYYIILHYFLSCLFMFFLLRYYKLSTLSSIFGGIVFSYSGYMLSIANMNTTLSSLVWLPLLMLFWDKMVNSQGREKVFPLLLSSLLLVMMFLGGEPTIVYMVMVFILPSYLLVFSPAESRKTNIFYYIVATSFAAVLSLVQLLPLIEFISNSSRGTGGSIKDLSEHAFYLRESIKIVFPDFWYNWKDFAGVNLSALMGQGFSPWLITVYVGIIPCALFAAGLKKDKRTLFYAGGLVLFFLLSLGTFSPFYRLFVAVVPGMNFIRFPIKYIFLVNFGFAIISAFGLENLVIGSTALARFKKTVFAYGAFLLLFVLFILAIPLRAYNFFLGFYPKEISPIAKKYLAENLITNSSTAMMIMVIIAIASFLVYLWENKRITTQKFQVLLASLVVIDLFLFNAPINFPVKLCDLSYKTKNHEYLIKNHPQGRLIIAEYPDFNQVGLDNIHKYNTAVFSNNSSMQYQIKKVIGFDSIELKNFWEMFSAIKEKRFSDIFPFFCASNVEYFLFADQANREKYGLKMVSPSSGEGVGGALYYNTRALPNHFETPRYKIIKNSSEAISFILSSKFDPREIIFMEDIPKCDRFYYLSNSFYPGWKAYVDGKEEKIYRANYLFRAVPLSKGPHKVEFVYDPWTFKFGLAISLASFIFLVIGLWKFRPAQK